MDLSAFILPDPAVRRDGWSPERKVRFLDSLAARGNVRAACGAVGMTREAAYALRRRDALFARGWEAALLLARERSVEVLADKAIDGIEEEVWHRGELMGTRRRFDARLLLAHITRLDRMAEEASASATRDAARFEELLACVAGAEVPEALRVDQEPLPLCRESALAMAEDTARDEVNAKWDERQTKAESESKPEELSDEEHDEYLRELRNGIAQARLEAAAEWDDWFESACRTTDTLLGRAQREAADSSPRTVSEVSGSSHAAGAGETEDG